MSHHRLIARLKAPGHCLKIETSLTHSVHVIHSLGTLTARACLRSAFGTVHFLAKLAGRVRFHFSDLWQPFVTALWCSILAWSDAASHADCFKGLLLAPAKHAVLNVDIKVQSPSRCTVGCIPNATCMGTSTRAHTADDDECSLPTVRASTTAQEHQGRHRCAPISAMFAPATTVRCTCVFDARLHRRRVSLRQMSAKAQNWLSAETGAMCTCRTEHGKWQCWRHQPRRLVQSRRPSGKSNVNQGIAGVPRVCRICCT